MTIGVNRETGEHLSGASHLAQSVRDILTTPIGSRVLRRDYGSMLYELIDRPMTDENIIDVYAAVAEALAKWEPRFLLKNVSVTKASQDGEIGLRLKGIAYPDWPKRTGREVELYV